MHIATQQLLNKIVNALVDVTGTVRRETREINASGDVVDIIKNYAQIRGIKEQIKEAREALDAFEESLSREEVPLAMRNAKVKTLTVEGVGRVTISARWSASMLNKQKGFDWLRSEGHGGVIQETVNAQTLAALAKELFTSSGKELPDDVFKVGQMTYTSITKA